MPRVGDRQPYTGPDTPLLLLGRDPGPDGLYGQYLTYMLVLLPVAWLAASVLRSRRDLPQAGGFQTVARN